MKVIVRYKSIGRISLKGGKGSGFEDHAGRPGFVGGSASGNIGFPETGTINEDVRKVIMDATQNIVREFPEIKDTFKGFDYTGRDMGNLPMEYNKEEGKLLIHNYYARKYTVKDWEEMFEETAPITVIGTSLKACILHEFGHVVHNTIRKKLSQDAFDVYWFKLKDLARILPSPSQYAERSTNEWVAERLLLEMLGKADPILKNLMKEYIQ